MKDFTRALSARYGATIAQQAISNAGLSANSELTGRTISSVVGFMSGSVKSIAERLGGKAYHTFHRGGANNIA